MPGPATPPSGTGSAPRRTWARRDVLALGGLALLGSAAGCTLSNPVITGPTPGTATSPTSPAPASAPVGPATSTLRLAAAEQGLGELAAAILAGPHRRDLSGRQRALLSWLGPVHAEHAAALAAPDPGSRPTSAAPTVGTPPSVAALSLAASLRRLAAEEAAQSARLRRSAVTLSGRAALAYGSMAVAGSTYADALPDPPAVVAPAAHRPAALVSDLAAMQQLVEQTHAVVYGYQLALGRLAAGRARDRAVTDLQDHRVLLARLSDRLLARSADVPAGAAAYTPAVAVRDSASAQTLLRRMETSLLPFCGLWLAAAATEADRTEALTTLAATTRTARSWGAGLRAWPGWSD